MEPAPLIAALERHAGAFRALLSGLSPEEAGWRPTPEAWSFLEILCHLADEEVEDFRARLEGTLLDPDAAWNPIDPEGWVLDRGYAEREPGAELERFLRERERSVAWLKGLDGPAWDRAHRHPSVGSLRAGDLLAAWVAHDALHLRQLARRIHQRVAHDAAPFSPDYAGPWGA